MSTALATVEVDRLAKLLRLIFATDKSGEAADAERDGHVRRLGQDRIQQIIASAFAPYRESAR